MKIQEIKTMIESQTGFKLSVRNFKKGSMKGFVGLSIIGKKEFDFNYIRTLKDYLSMNGQKCIVNNYQLFIN
jgi:hypothetical protein